MIGVSSHQTRLAESSAGSCADWAVVSVVALLYERFLALITAANGGIRSDRLATITGLGSRKLHPCRRPHSALCGECGLNQATTCGLNSHRSITIRVEPCTQWLGGPSPCILTSDTFRRSFDRSPPGKAPCQREHFIVKLGRPPEAPPVNLFNFAGG